MEWLSNWINNFTATPIELMVICGIICGMGIYMCYQAYENYRLRKELRRLKESIN